MDEVCRTAPDSISGAIADVSVEANVQQLIGGVADQFGRLDVLVNNVGVAGHMGPIATMPTASLRYVLSTNLESQFFCVREALSLLKEAPEASITNLSSIAGRIGYRDRTSYAASKWGVIGFTKSLAAELGPIGIRVNAVCPGAVAGPPIEKAIERRAAADGISIDAARDKYLRQSSLRRFVSAEEVANVVVFLSSSAARGISGQAIGVDADTTSLV